MWKNMIRNMEWLVIVALLVGAVMAVGCQGTTIDNTSAYAGPDKYIVLGASCSIQGSNVFKNSITQKDTALGNPSWVSISAPVTPVNFTQGSNITNSNIYELTFTPSALGIYEFKFSTSILGALSEDTVKVIVIPSADVGPDQTVPVNTPVTVTGTSPVDSSHLVWWDCTSAPAGVDTSGLHFTQNVATFTPTVVGIYTFSYIIGKNNEIEADYFFTDTVTITVVSSGGGNTPPVANAGTAKTGISIGSQVLLSGSGSDADNNPLTYKWTLANPPISINTATPTLFGADTAAPYFTPVESGTYTASLIVNDGKVDSSPSSVTITVDAPVVPSNIAPVANAGPDQSATAGNVVTLSGTMSSDANGNALTYAWALSTPNGSSATLAGETTVQPTFTPDIAGNYTATLIVNDGIVNSAADTVVITVNSQASSVIVDTEALMLSAVSGKAFLVANSSSVLYDVLEFSVNTAGGTAPYSHIGKYINNTWYNYGIRWEYFVSSTLARLAVYEPGIGYVLNPTGYMTETATTLNVPGYPQNAGLTGTAAETWLKVAPVAASDFSGHTLAAYVDVYSLSYSFTADNKGTYNDGYGNVSFSWSIDASSRKAILSFADGSKHNLYLTTRGLINGSREAGIIKIDPAGSVTSGALNTWTYN